MLERIKELIKPVTTGSEENYETASELPIDDSNADGDLDASNPSCKGE